MNSVLRNGFRFESPDSSFVIIDLLPDSQDFSKPSFDHLDEARGIDFCSLPQLVDLDFEIIESDFESIESTFKIIESAFELVKSRVHLFEATINVEFKRFCLYLQPRIESRIHPPFECRKLPYQYPSIKGSFLRLSSFFHDSSASLKWISYLFDKCWLFVIDQWKGLKGVKL